MSNQSIPDPIGEMGFYDFVESMRQEIREEGFLTLPKLLYRMVLRMKEKGLDFDRVEVMRALPCDNIELIRYSRWTTEGTKLKRLWRFYKEEDDE